MLINLGFLLTLKILFYFIIFTVPPLCLISGPNILRLPAAYYNEKLLKVGDRLCEMKVSTCGVKGPNETHLANYYYWIAFSFTPFDFCCCWKNPGNMLKILMRHSDRESVHF